MDRMTEKGPNGYYIPAERGTFGVEVDRYRKVDGTRFTGSVVDRLGAFEECGLKPEEVSQLAHDWTKYETAMSYVDEMGGVEDLKRVVGQEGKPRNPYPEYILRYLRQRWGLDANDTSRDEVFRNMDQRRVFKEVLVWNGLIGGWGNQIIGWIKDIFGVDLDE